METICMKCQILFSGKYKKNINLSSAELAQRVVKVKTLNQENTALTALVDQLSLSVPVCWESGPERGRETNP